MTKLFLIAVLSIGASFAQAHTPTCYSYKAAEVKVEWTSYKTTDRIPVTGQFTKVKFTSADHTASLTDLLQGAQFEIDPLAISTGRAKRDSNLLQGFFSHIVPMISGQVQNVQPASAKDGQLSLALRLNGQDRLITMNYSMDDQHIFHATASLNMSDFALDHALQMLDLICHEAHTGNDGISKVWDDVTLNVTAPLMDCP